VPQQDRRELNHGTRIRRSKGGYRRVTKTKVGSHNLNTCIAVNGMSSFFRCSLSNMSRAQLLPGTIREKK
jgi:hypothetical protein